MNNVFSQLKEVFKVSTTMLDHCRIVAAGNDLGREFDTAQELHNSVYAELQRETPDEQTVLDYLTQINEVSGFGNPQAVIDRETYIEPDDFTVYFQEQIRRADAIRRGVSEGNG